MSKQIVVIGTGRLAKEFSLLMINWGYNICCFVDNKPVLPSLVIEGIGVESMDKFREIELDKIDIYIAKKKMFITPILCYLKDLNVGMVYVVDNDFLYEDKSLIKKKTNYKYIQKVFLENAPVIGYLETNIIDQCNLKCAGCTHFSGIASGKREIENIISDIEMLKKCTVLNFRLLGGEPLLLPELDLIIIKAREILGKKCKIEIVTNGLLIPKLNKKIISIIKMYDVKMNISLYEPTNAMLEEIICVLENENISYCINDEGTEERRVIEKFHTCLTCNRDNNGKLASSVCYNNGCAFLRDRRIYRCAYPGLIKFANEKFMLNLNVSPEDYIDGEVSLEWKDIKKISQSVPFCNYCSEKKKEFVWNLQDTNKLSSYFL